MKKRLLSLLLAALLLVSLMPRFASRADAAEVYFGIDVSENNGDIDWASVANNVDFAIVRCGYGMDQTDQDDSDWAYNANACVQYGIPFGTYIYSYANTTARAQSEAEHVLRLVAGYDMDLPIFYDLEDSSVSSSCTPYEIYQIAKTFCDTITAAGYKVGIYANLNWWENYLYYSDYDQWYRWVAQYDSSCDYAGDYCMWQYSEYGYVSGISGNVDVNYWYGSFPGASSGPVEHDCVYNTFAFIEADHPHYSCYACSICGDIRRDESETNTYDQCFLCNTPSEPSLLNMGTAYAPDVPITFQWEATTNTTHNNLWLETKTAGGDYEKYEYISYAESGLSRSLPTGEYRVQLQAYNFNFWENDVCPKAFSQWYYFTVAEDYLCQLNGHNMQTVRTEPTCTTEGRIAEVCTRCGAVGSETVLSATGHTPAADDAVAPTCTAAGLTAGSHCSVCGVVLTAQTVVPAAGHTEVTDNGIAATCTETGLTAGTHCSTCGEILVPQTVIPAKGHTDGFFTDNLDGTHAVFCSVCGQIARYEEHSFDGGVCVCGAEAPASDPVYDANLIFRYNSFTMGSALNVVYIVGAGTTNYADVRAVVTKYNADGTTTEKTYSIADGTMKDSGSISTFTFDGVAAKELGDTFVAKLYATGKDGTEYYGEEKTLSLKSILLPYTQEADSAKKDLAVALLNYGAAAQVYFSYNYDETDPTTLVNNDLTADQKVIDIREASATASITGEGAKNVYNTVLLESKIVLYAIFNLSDYSTRIGELTAVVTNTETGETVATLPVTAMGTNGSFRFDDVSAKDTRTMFSIAIYDGETKVSQDLQWSVECMVSGCRADANTSQAKLNLANAILAYGDYAAAYLGA